MTPTDVGTLIAIYGDKSSEKKHCEYIKLMEDTVEINSHIYGDYQKYFKTGYELPECDLCK